MQLSYFQEIHGFTTGTIENTQDSNQQESRTTHQHQGQFHGCIFFLSATPYANEQIHGDKSHFVEHEHGEQVDGNEETEYSGTEQGKPQEVFLGHGLELPGGKGTGEYDDGTEQ